MEPPDRTARGLFVSSRGHLGDGKGGVQLCTNEFIEVIEAAGVSLTTLPFDGDRSWSARLLRLIDSSPFVRPHGRSLAGDIVRAVQQQPVDYIFLNQEFLAPVAPVIRPKLPAGCRIVILSHGAEITDLLHSVRLSHRLPLSRRLLPTPALLLGRVLASEQKLREDVDAVCTIALFDADLERWFGARRVAWIPRLIKPAPLDWRPAGDRWGFVGTLDHGPNLEGLVAILDGLARTPGPPTRVRVVGSPTSLGQWLAGKYGSVDYLGTLDDAALAAEAATWSVFLHPIFCRPRGCSTKLAIGIAWQIPIVTTAEGRRGYLWDDGTMPEARDADDFVRLCRALLEPAVARKAQRDIARVAASSPSLTRVAAIMRELLV